MKRLRVVAQGRSWFGLIRRSSGTATALVALLLLSLAAPAASPDVLGTQRVNDSFSGSVINPDIWQNLGTTRPDAVAISQAEGHLTVNISGRAGDNFNAALSTRCRAHGDFDARISFDLSAWPAYDGVWVALMAFDGWNLVGNVYRVFASWGDSYGVYYPPSAGTVVPAAGSRGSMRLVRQGATMTGYYWAGYQWMPVFAGAVPVSDVNLNLGVFNGADATHFGHDWALIQFNDFHLTADGIICP
jgi:hypothetical protein